jgi:single-stranded-DNA-specific exonuclease
MLPVLIKKWDIPQKLPVEIDDQLKDYPPFLRQILYNRGIEDGIQAQRFLDGQEEVGDPFLLTDMEAAVERLFWAIDHQESIAVYGDYDVDGVTATALMVEVLRVMGGKAEAYIPNRFEEGYGLNNEALDILAQNGTRLVVTVDCGIRSPREAQYASKLGLDLIISDHHHPHDELPTARAVICPKRSGDIFPEKNLAGVGLAYKLAEALFSRRSVNGYSVKDWLDLVALGTVADIVPLVGENRMLVRAGLNLMRLGQRPGLLALGHAAGLNIAGLSTGDIGFGLAPRLNAAGRLESAIAAYNLLTSRDLSETGLLAQKLDDQNRERQKLTLEMQKEAERQLVDPQKAYLLTAFNEDFNSGVVGLVAAKLAESYYRPAIVGTIVDGYARASCRSIPEFHVTQALDECADLMVRHGGHAMAAGFTVKVENFDELIFRLNEISQRELAHLDLQPVLRADLEIPLRELHPDYLVYLDRLQPTGHHNPEATFVSRNLRVMSSRSVGVEKRHLKLSVSDGRITYDAIAFRQGDWIDKLPEQIDLLYTFERNVYNRRETLQLNVRDIKPSNITG